MPGKRKNRVCPVKHAGSLDNRIRRWIQNPRKILGPFVREGMTVLDIGCGPGFFTIDMAGMVGPHGRVIASDLQEGMLEKLRDKVRGTTYEERITLHHSGQRGLEGIEEVDFALAFYMVHEVPEKKPFFRDLYLTLRPGGQLLVVEPPFHVSGKEMAQTIRIAGEAGFAAAPGPGMIFSKTVLFMK